MKKDGIILELKIHIWDIFEVENEYIILRFPSMCNIGWEMRGALEEIFGETNVDYFSY